MQSLYVAARKADQHVKRFEATLRRARSNRSPSFVLWSKHTPLPLILVASVSSKHDPRWNTYTQESVAAGLQVRVMRRCIFFCRPKKIEYSWIPVVSRTFSSALKCSSLPSGTTKVSHCKKNLATGGPPASVTAVPFPPTCSPPLPSAVFSFKEHLRDDGERLPVTFISAVKTLLDVRDVAHTLADHVQVSASPL